MGTRRTVVGGGNDWSSSLLPISTTNAAAHATRNEPIFETVITFSFSFKNLIWKKEWNHGNAAKQLLEENIWLGMNGVSGWEICNQLPVSHNLSLSRGSNKKSCP